MSTPTSRTSRSPFSRSPRSRRAAPGAPAAVTRIVVIAAMLLASRERVVQERERRLDVRGVAARDAERQPVQHHREKAAEVDRVDVAPQRAVGLAGLKPVEQLVPRLLVR